MKLYWTPEAIQDREAIYDFVENNNAIAALTLDELFEEKSAQLIDYPAFGRTGRVAGTRELVVHQNYILIYDLTGNQVRIIRLLHVARPWPSEI